MSCNQQRSYAFDVPAPLRELQKPPETPSLESIM
jgi:hypothetical protein